MTMSVTEHVNVAAHTADSTLKDNAVTFVPGPSSRSAPTDSKSVTWTLVSLRSETGTSFMIASANAAANGKCGLSDWMPPPPGSGTSVAVMTTANDSGAHGGDEGGGDSGGENGGGSGGSIGG